MDEQLKSNLLSGKHWMRFFYMVLFIVCLQVAGFVMWVLIGLQFLFALISGQDNPKLRAFGLSLSDYIYQALQFLTYNSESKPFPFSDWPKVEVEETVLEGQVESAEQNDISSDDENEDEAVAETEK